MGIGRLVGRETESECVIPNMCRVFFCFVVVRTRAVSRDHPHVAVHPLPVATTTLHDTLARLADQFLKLLPHFWDTHHQLSMKTLLSNNSELDAPSLTWVRVARVQSCRDGANTSPFDNGYTRSAGSTSRTHDSCSKK